MNTQTNKNPSFSWKQWMRDEIAKDQAKLIQIRKDQLVSESSSYILLSKDSSRQQTSAVNKEKSRQQREQQLVTSQEAT